MALKGKLISGNVRELRYNPGEADGLAQRYRYDADNRLTHAYARFGPVASTAARPGDLVEFDRHARYRYYAHGPLARLELGDDLVQGLDYRYTLQGWIKGVNDADPADQGQAPESSLLALAMATNAGTPDGLAGDMALGNVSRYTPRDAFDYGLAYYPEDYRAVGGDASGRTATTTATNGLYNGNVAAMRTSVPLRGDGTGAAAQALRRRPLAFDYRYDQLHRIRAADAPGTGLATSYTYDPHGNLQTLIRSDLSGALVDSLAYTYGDVNGPNRLSRLRDMSAGAGGVKPGIDNNFRYDERGNLTEDALGNEYIRWNGYGKVVYKTLRQASYQTIAYAYDAQGNRLSKAVLKNAGDNVETTVHVRDASGTILRTYEDEVEAICRWRGIMEI